MLDTRRIRSAFERAAPGFDDADFLHADIRERLLSRLQLVRIDPERILDLGAGTATATSGLAACFPGRAIIAVDFARPMLTAGATTAPENRTPVCADATRLPLVDESVDLIFSNLMLPYCPEPDAVLAEARRVLRYPGLLTFSTFGPDSLIELREAWARADGYSHVAGFPDMHHVGDALVQAGFAEPVVDVEKLTVTYADMPRMMADLRSAGSTNATPRRNPGLTGRRRWSQMCEAYNELRDSNGRLPVSLEIVFGLAWRGQTDTTDGTSDDVVEIPVDRLSRRA